MSLREGLKRVTERCIVALGGPRMIRIVRGGGGIIVNYHNVHRDDAPPGGDVSLHMPRSAFADHLDILMETFRVVELDSVIRNERRGDGEPLAAITVDDGYRGALTVGLEELRSRGLPVTVFVSPALLGADALWWDALVPPGEEALPPTAREEALRRAKGRPPDVWRWAEGRGLDRRPQPRHAGLVDEEELAEVAALAGVRLGAHGWSHADLTQLDPEELEDELHRPLAWLRERFPEAVVPWLSLPYGRSTDQVVAAAVEAGYHGVLDLSGRLVAASRGSSVRTVPRQNVPSGLSPSGLLLRASGL